MKRQWFCMIHPGITVGAIALFATACTQSSANLGIFSEESSTTSTSESGALATDAVDVADPVRYETHELDTAIVHTVSIAAAASAQVTVMTSQELTPLDDLVESVGAIAAINAGFFDPNNQQTTSFIRLDGEVVADPRDNDRLMQNPDLASYLDAILNRSEFRHYRCTTESGGSSTNSSNSSSVEFSDYAITPHDAPVPPQCRIHSSVGAGPQLLPQLTSVEEGFLTYNTSGQVVRDAIGSLSPNARSAIGITADNTLVLAMVAQRGDRPTPTGLSLPDFADFLESIGVEQALNLDGGSSTSLFYHGETYYGRLNAEGQPIERSVKSAILILD
ncbi:MAG: phosphodiester glycosidase family protein [Elainellaceae cyanobacterium]